MRLDPITLALVQKRLDYISRQMGWVMTRTARSPIFSQSHDFSCFIANAEGTLVANADGIPIHTGGGGFAVRALLKAWAGRIEDGDIFLLNDPYVAGGNHLPDWVIARPVFVEGRLTAFACNRAHQLDIGGGAAGTYNSAASEIFHEGIRLPPLKLFERGTLREDLWQLLMINCRTPDYLDGDLRAMIGSTKIGAERVGALMAELGPDAGEAYIRGILDHADTRFRAALSGLPDGSWSAEEVIDNDCFETVAIPLRVTLTKRGDRLTVDFTGTGAQMRGFKNSSLANTYSAVYLALAAFFEPDIPRNEGTFRAVDIVTPEGTVINPRPPAALTMCTVFIAHEIVHVMWRALAQADPKRSCAGWGKSVHGTTSGGFDGLPTYIMYHWHSFGGGGAVQGRDGFNQIGHLIALGGMTLPNVENWERLYPARYLRQEFRTDGGGPGTYRGGTGVHYAVQMERPGEYAFRGEGVGAPTGWGVVGGNDGGDGSMRLHLDTGEVIDCPKYGVRRYGTGRLEAFSPGGGGWGSPRARDPDLVARDVKDGVVSPAVARDVYGVVLDARGQVDAAATARLRGSAAAD
jgi:N-methylhydantoinase B